MTALFGLLGTFASVIRWAEPWDIEPDDDPLLLGRADGLELLG